MKIPTHQEDHEVHNMLKVVEEWKALQDSESARRRQENPCPES